VKFAFPKMSICLFCFSTFTLRTQSVFLGTECRMDESCIKKFAKDVKESVVA
jgi:hypothetical protein